MTSIQEKNCGHKYECGCYKELCKDCIELLENGDCDTCDDEGCNNYYTFRNDNCNCNSYHCGYCNENENERKNICPEFDTDNLDTALYQDNCDWSFDKPINKPYHTIYIFDKEEE